MGRSEPPGLVLASIQSLIEPVPEPALLESQTRTLEVGEEIEIQALARWLVENGYHNTTAVELPGEFSVRGGIVDIFAPDWYHPVRAEFFGDQIDSLRQFEVATQRSLEKLAAIELTVLEPTADYRGHLADYLPPGSLFLLVEPEELQDEGRRYLERLERPQDVHSVRSVFEQAMRFPSVTALAIAASSLETTCRLKIESVERFSGAIGKVRQELEEAGTGQEVLVVCQTTAEARRLSELFSGTRLAGAGKLHYPIGHLKSGFRLVPDAIVLVSSGELFNREDLRRPVRRRLSRAIDSFVELREGDLVVHVSHGIGRYRGIKLLEKDQQAEEHLVIEFQGGTKLYVPSAKVGLVQKYVGGAKSRPRLAKLGGRLWGRQKQAVQEAVNDMAAEMLELQAARASRPGITFPQDTEWQREFDACFPYRETDDQLLGIEAIKRDMSLPKPMDRLLCGDVGFGKTELAMRAAFKAVDAGYQVAILVPTTVLAEQHLRTFSGRMAEFPFEIVSLSRFATRGQQAKIIQRLEAGEIDIVIGTHRLVQPDVRFQNLGLAIIDEEQRFGVEVKERLKALRQIIDVLTMTATPIPRTLHMSLLGLRDISNLETPPEDRLAMETRVGRFDAELIRHAVLRELNRDGQIFFVHNRVYDIELIASDSARSCPRPDRGGPRPDAGARARAGDAGLRPRQNRPAAVHHDRRKRPGHPQRQHDLHRPGRPLRAGRPAPASRPRGPLQAPRLLLPLVDPKKQSPSNAARRLKRHRGVQRAWGWLRHRHARPRNPRCGQHPRHRAERPHRPGGLRALLRASGAGRPAAQAATAQDLDRRRPELAQPGLLAPQLRPRPAAEDRPLSPPGPGDRRRGAGRLPPRASRPFRSAAARRRAVVAAGESADRRASLGD